MIASKYARLGLLLIGVVFGTVTLVQTSWFRSTKSVTFDETYFLSCALQTVHDGRLDSRICSQGVAPLPILLDYLLPLSFSGGEDRAEPWEGQPQDARLIDGPRLANSIVVGLPLVLVVAWWLMRRQGILAAALGAGLIAFSPTMAAHSALATTDACFALFGMVALAAIAWCFRRPTRSRFVLMSLAIAAAMAAKYSGVFLLPVVAAMLVLKVVGPETREDRPGWQSKLAYLVSRGATLGVLVFVFWWGLHLFTFTGPLKNIPLEETPEWSPWVKMLGRGPVADEVMRLAHEKVFRPAPLDGVLFQYLHNKAGHSTFLAGQHSNTGWWHYFPCAFLIKSTPVELFLAAGLLVLGVGAFRFPRRVWTSLDIDLQVLSLAVSIFCFLIMTSHVQLGQRYILILYPILVVAGVDRLWARLARRPKVAAGCAVVLLAGQAVSCFSVAPHYLAYFNCLAGGPEGGWRYLVGSNIDWGQDLPGLRDELRRLDARRVALRYFGTAAPQAYGVEADQIPDLAAPLDQYDLLAVSVSPLQGLYAAADDPFREFRAIEPTARAGKSIFLYALDRPETKDAFQSAIACYRAIRLFPDATTMGGLPAYRIKTPTAVYVLEKSGAGLASMIDRDGHDWIAFDHTPGSGARGERRGFPNAVATKSGSVFRPRNPASGPCATKVEHAGDDRVTITAVSSDDRWACRYDFLPTHCTFTMTRTPPDERYEFSYQGVPGGDCDSTDWRITSGTNRRRSAAEPFTADLPAPEWAVFGDPKFNRVLYLLHHEDDDWPDQTRSIEGRMVLFGFGRENDEQRLNRSPQRFTIGFLETSEPGEILEFVGRLPRN